MSETARERVALAIYDANTLPNWQAWERESAGTQSIYRDQADAAIAAHSADLWQRALDPATVEAVAKDIATANGDPYDGLYEAWKRRYREQARASITALLTALLGPRPESEVQGE